MSSAAAIFTSLARVTKLVGDLVEQGAEGEKEAEAALSVCLADLSAERARLTRRIESSEDERIAELREKEHTKP